jgi:hypothetical protein
VSWHKPEWACDDFRRTARQRSQDGVQYEVQLFTNILSQEPQHEVPILLKQVILSAVTPVRDGIIKMLPTIQFDRHTSSSAKEIDFEFTLSVEWDGQLLV